MIDQCLQYSIIHKKIKYRFEQRCRGKKFLSKLQYQIIVVYSTSYNECHTTINTFGHDYTLTFRSFTY